MSTKEVLKIGDFTDEERRKMEDRIFILESLIDRIQSGEITEFVVAANTLDNNVEVSMYTADFLGAIGIMETGKHILMTQRPEMLDDDLDITFDPETDEDEE